MKYIANMHVVNLAIRTHAHTHVYFHAHRTVPSQNLLTDESITGAVLLCKNIKYKNKTNTEDAEMYKKHTIK